ncbi:MAG: hypothetical protein ACK2T7_13655 [Anaerolineales bacterium]
MDVFRRLKEKVKAVLDFDAINAWWAGFRLSPGWVRGPVIGVGLLVLVLAGYYGVTIQTGYGLLVDLFAPVILAALGYLLILSVGGWLLRMLLKLPALLWVVVAAAVLFGAEVWGDRTSIHWALNLGVLAGVILFSTALVGIVRDWQTALLRKKIMLAAFGLFGTGILVIAGALIFSPGRPSAVLPVEIALGETQIDMPDPSQPGTYPVEFLTYGSGADLHSPEYG